MLPSRRLLQPCRITLFTRDNCGLCLDATTVLSELSRRRPFLYNRIDLAIPQSKVWRELYDFDIPVIHISKSAAAEEDISTAAKAVKMMHRFTSAPVEAKMDQVEASQLGSSFVAADPHGSIPPTS